MQTTHVRAADVEERWLLYDASEHILGRMATEIARSLMGKDRPAYTPSQATGAHVVVINAEKPRLTGKKLQQKSYDHYTGYAGGLRTVTIARMLERKPEDVVRLAVRRMLPKNKLGRELYKRLLVYAGTEHPHRAQKPQKVEPPRS
jgi:large subunit ribosomal protein L13